MVEIECTTPAQAQAKEDSRDPSPHSQALAVGRFWEEGLVFFKSVAPVKSTGLQRKANFQSI